MDVEGLAGDALRLRKSQVGSFLEALNSAVVDLVHYPYPSFEIERSVRMTYRRLQPLLTFFGFLVFLRPGSGETILALPTLPVSAARFPPQNIWKYMEEWGLTALALEKGLGQDDLRRLLALLSAPSRGMRPETDFSTYVRGSGIKGVKVARTAIPFQRCEEAVQSLKERRLAVVRDVLLMGEGLFRLEELGDLEVVELAASLRQEGHEGMFSRIVEAIWRNAAREGEVAERARRMLSLIEGRVGGGERVLPGKRENAHSMKAPVSRNTSERGGREGLGGEIAGAGVLHRSRSAEPGGEGNGLPHSHDAVGRRESWRDNGLTLCEPLTEGAVKPAGGVEDAAAVEGGVGDVPARPRKDVPESRGRGEEEPKYREGERDVRWASRVLEGNYREETCLEALLLLAEWGGEEAQPILRRSFRHPLPGVRAAACRVAARVLEEGEAEETLLSALRDPYPEVREEAVRTLGEVGGAGAEKALISLLRKGREEPEVMAEACLALAKRGGDKARKTLRKVFTGWRRWGGEAPTAVLAAACSALGRIGREEDAELVRKYLEHPEPLIREQARQALKEMRSRGLRV